jgi:transketolase
MRSAFISGLLEIAAQDERTLLLTGDLGFTVLEPFAERFPDRFYNVGVAEQNMAGMAAGLADAGFIPYIYSIATFASMRGYEFIRNGAILHGLPVRVVGVGGGVDYGHNGITHYAIEDIGIMRVQPGITVIAPADPQQTRSALAAAHELSGPAYLRLGKESSGVPGLDGRFELGRLQLIGDGTDVAIVSVGNMTSVAVAAMDVLAAKGVNATVAVVSSFNPSPAPDLAELLATVPLAVSVEAHYVTGGVGSFAAEVIAEHQLSCRLVRAGIEATPVGISGSRDFLYEELGISAQRLATAALTARPVARD